MRPNLATLLLTGLIALSTTAAHAADLKSPAKVKQGLRILSQVEDDFNRKITGKLYDRVPHENEEFIEGAGVLRAAIADEPADFKSTATAALQKALDAAQHVSDLSKSRNDADLATGMSTFSTAITDLDTLFPAELRPTSK